MSSQLETIDRRIADLRATHERIAQNLVELDDDVTRQMLEASSSLAGTTAEQWARAQQAISALWQGQLALADVLERVADARGTKSSPTRASLGRLHELLDGPSVPVARPGAQRALTEAEAPTDLLTVEAVIAGMSADYDAVMALVNEVAAVWTVIVPRLAALEAAIGDLESAADSSAVRRPNELASARRAVVDAEDLAHRDPLALSDDALSSISAMVDRAAASIRDSRAARHELLAELASVTATLDDDRRALDAARSARTETAAKVLTPEAERAELDEAAAGLADLERCVADVRRLAETSPAEARRQLPALAQRSADLGERIGQLARAGGSGTATRDELRGRLEAYRAKAKALGRSEDRQLDRLYVEARDVLYSAPCDLDRAHALVVEYQRTVGPRTGAAT
ncbi:MAG TPA: hypothetical protein VK277_05650 [Acidimicrobiales bacterium]|nr:hypothetical protein [Acidimicrobiales bacterium]